MAFVRFLVAFRYEQKMKIVDFGELSESPLCFLRVSPMVVDADLVGGVRPISRLSRNPSRGERNCSVWHDTNTSS